MLFFERRKKALKQSLFIMLVLYGLAGLIPCNNTSVLTICTGWVFEPLGMIALFAAQFGIVFNLFSLKYYTSIGMNPFPNFSQFILIWSIILAPLYMGVVFENIKRLHQS